jgi:hypothetical protein
MKVIGTILCLVLFLGSVPVQAKWKKTIKRYECMEVEKFKVASVYSSKKKQRRVVKVPDSFLSQVQAKIIAEIKREKKIKHVVNAELMTCGSNGLVFGGTVQDYIPIHDVTNGDGWGVALQKFEATTFIRDKGNGTIIMTKRIIDREPHGSRGGTVARGQLEFARKSAYFATRGR